MTATHQPPDRGRDDDDACAASGWEAWWALAALWLERFVDSVVFREAMWEETGQPDVPPTSPWLAYLEVAPHLPARERRVWLRECLACLVWTRGAQTWRRGMRRGKLWAWSARGVAAAWRRLGRLYAQGIKRGRLARSRLPRAFRAALPANADPPAGATEIGAVALE